MKKICHWLGTWSSIFICGTVPVLSVPRTNVVITGTTVASGWERREGKPSSSCPESHPWAISLGTVCCQRFHHKADMNLPLEWNDPPTACWNSEWISCPTLRGSGQLCRTNNNFVDPIRCPNSHPIQMHNACCQNYRRSPECGGELIQPDDDPNCCANHLVFQPMDCSNFKRKCKANPAENVTTYCPRSPSKRRFHPDKDVAFVASQGPVAYNDVGGICTSFSGRLITWEEDLIKDALNFLRGEYPNQSRSQKYTYLTAPKLSNGMYSCYSQNACQGKIVDSYSDEVIDLMQSLGSFATTYGISLLWQPSLALEMSLEEPVSMKVVDIFHGGGSGGYICDIQCLL